MGFGMEVMIMLALAAYVVTTVVSFVLAVWFVRTFAPFYKLMAKQLQEQFGSETKKEA